MEIQNLQIEEMKEGLVKGVDVSFTNETDVYKESYFEWNETSFSAGFETKEISGGVLTSWHHAPVFREAENHIDAELFYFLSGIALMYFVDYRNGEPDIKTSQIVRIKAGTKIIIRKGKGHFVPVAEGDEPVVMVVVAPKMDAPRKSLAAEVRAV